MKTVAVCAYQQKSLVRVPMLIALGFGLTVGLAQGQTMSFFRQFDTMGMDRLPL